MRLLRRELLTAGLALSLGGCLFASMRNENAQPAPSLTAARMQASNAAPMLPILVLRTARDDLDLAEADRAGVVMILDSAELDARTLDRARAALLEILARSVEIGSIDESQAALFIEQMAWAAGDVAPRMLAALDHLYELLNPEQRRALVARVGEKLPTWAPTWATEREHRWLTEYPSRTYPDFAGDLVRTSRTWAERSVEHVRAVLPKLDAAQRRALAASLRHGVTD